MPASFAGVGRQAGVEDEATEDESSRWTASAGQGGVRL